MRRLDQVLAVVAEWVQKAENDLTTAAHTLKLRAKCPTDTVCFHAQQCVEKYLKALLVLNGVSFPKTHDIEDILALVPAPCRPDLSIDDQARLTNYATVARYPGGQPPIALAETLGDGHFVSPLDNMRHTSTDGTTNGVPRAPCPPARICRRLVTLPGLDRPSAAP